MRRAPVLPLIFLSALSILLDYYVFQGVKTLCTPFEVNTTLVIFYLYWIGSLAILVSFLANFYRAVPTGKFTLLFNTVFNAFVTLFVTKLLFALILLTGDIYRLVFGLFAYYPERSLTLSRIALGFSAVAFFSFLYGVTRGKYNYKVRRTRLYIDDLPRNFDGFRIVQISDVHAGSFDSVKGVEKGIALINAQNADVFVFTGDLVNNQASEIEPWIPLFSRIQAKSGKFSILGNHDYGDYVQWPNTEAKFRNLQQLKRNHEKLGFKLLLDEHLEITRDDQFITLLGVENWGIGFGKRGNLNAALNGSDFNSVKILLSHDPSHWDAEVKNHPAHIHLTLSGHTHGMQFGIEFAGFKWSPVKYRYPNWAGLARHHDRFLYVNRGFGFLGFAGRIGIWPEITVIELARAKR